MHMAMRLERQAVPVAGGADLFGHVAQIAQVTMIGGQAEQDVLGHGEGIEQREMLEHHGDAQRARLVRIGDLDRLAVELHFAGIGLDRAEDEFHQRRLAGAVLAQHGMDLARRDGEAHAVVGDHAGVSLGHACQRQARRKWCHNRLARGFRAACREPEAPPKRSCMGC